MSDIVRITVTPRVKRYLSIQFGNYLRLSDHNIYSSLLRKLFQKFDKVDPSRVRPDIKKTSLGEYYDIAMGNNGLKKYGGFMTGENLVAFSDSVDLNIKQELIRWVDHPNNPDTKVDYSIRSFLDWYQFPEEEFTFDNAKRWYYRERERQMKRFEESKKIIPQLVIPLNIEAEIRRKAPLINPVAQRQLSLLYG